MYRTRVGAPPPGWDLPPGWGQPLDDPLPLRAAGSVGRWLYPTLTVAGFLLVAGFVLGHDDPTPGLSTRGLLAIALAATVVILLTLRRSTGPGPLTRALGEYTVVALLAVLVATTGIPLDPPPTTTKKANAAADHRPALVKTIDTWQDRLVGAWEWLAELWRRADTQTTPHPQAPATTSTPAPTGQAMAPSPTLSRLTRRPL